MTRMQRVGFLLLGLLMTTQAHAQITGLSPTERALLLGLGVSRAGNADFARAVWALNTVERSRMMQQQQLIQQRMAARRATADRQRIDAALGRGRTTARRSAAVSGAEPAQEPLNQGIDSDILLVWEVFGATFMPMNPRDVSLINPNFDGGLRVAAIRIGGPIDLAGWAGGDILVGLDRYRIRSYDNLGFVAELPDLSARNPLQVRLLHEGKLVAGTLDIFARAPEPEPAPPASPTEPAQPTVPSQLRSKPPEVTLDEQRDGRIWDRVGIRFRSTELAREGIDFSQGLLIEQIRPASPAERAGWQQTEVLVGLGDYQIRMPEDLDYVLAKYPGTTSLPWIAVAPGGLRRGEITVAASAVETVEPAAEEPLPSEPGTP